MIPILLLGLFLSSWFSTLFLPALYLSAGDDPPCQAHCSSGKGMDGQLFLSTWPQSLCLYTCRLAVYTAGQWFLVDAAHWACPCGWPHQTLWMYPRALHIEAPLSLLPQLWLLMDFIQHQGCIDAGVKWTGLYPALFGVKCRVGVSDHVKLNYLPTLDVIMILL